MHDFVCKCDDKYEGLYCEKCKDPTMGYPDCDIPLFINGKELANLAFLDRSQYNADGYEKAAVIDYKAIAEGAMHKQQCLLATYPTDLDKIEFTGMLGGPIHIADFYSINHDQDNLIKFTPRSEGTIKILIQQPEIEQLRVNEESYVLS